MIHVIYKVEVHIPEALYQRLEEFSYYSKEVVKATHGAMAAGQDSYGMPFEWATFDDRAAAERCEKRLNTIMTHYLKYL